MPEPITLKQILAKLMIIEYDNFVENGGSCIEDLSNINENDKCLLANLLAHCNIDDVKFTDDMIIEMEDYLELDDDDENYSLNTLFSFYSEQFINELSNESVVKLYKMGRDLLIR